MFLSWLRLSAFSAAVLAAGFAQSLPLRLAGIAAGPQGTQVLLVTVGTGQSGWSEPGGTFGGYRILSCDARAGEVTVAAGGRIQRLALDSDRITASSPGVEKLRAAIRANLRSLAAAGYQRCIETGQPQVGFAEIVGRDLPLFQLDPADGEDYSQLVVSLRDCRLSVITRSGEMVDWRAPEPAEVRMAPGTSLADLSRATGIAVPELSSRNPQLNASGTFSDYQAVVLP